MEFLWFTFKFLCLIVGCFLLLAILVALVETLVERILFKKKLETRINEMVDVIIPEVDENEVPIKKTKRTTKKKDQK